MCYRITIYCRMKFFINVCNVENCTHNSWKHKLTLDLSNAKKISQIVCKERQQFWHPVTVFFFWSAFSRESYQVRKGDLRVITSPGWMHETRARTWCTGKTQREWGEREVGGGIGMGNTCKPMGDSSQCMTKSTTIL